MQSLIHADLFFFISSIGFVILFILLAWVLIATIRFIRSLQRTLTLLQRKATELEAEAEELLEEVRGSVLFRLLFGRTRRKK